MVYPVFCQEKPDDRSYCFSLGTQFGFVHGQSIELVYPSATKGELLSELTYDMKPVYYYGFQVDFGRNNLMSAPGFFASLSFKTGIPGDSGTHENRDWMSIENGSLTHFSTHTNKTREFHWLETYIGASIPVASYFYIKPFFSGSWMHFAFTGRDGNATYARKTSCTCGLNIHLEGCPAKGTPDYTSYRPIGNNPHHYSFNGDAIRYQQDWLIVATGFSIGTNILSPFSFDFTFQLSPFAYCAAIDNHLLREPPITFYDFVFNGFFIEPRGSVSFVYKRIDLSLEAAYRHIGRTRAETYYIKDGSNTYNTAAEKGGAGLSLIDARFLFKVRF